MPLPYGIIRAVHLYLLIKTCAAEISIKNSISGIELWGFAPSAPLVLALRY